MTDFNSLLSETDKSCIQKIRKAREDLMQWTFYQWTKNTHFIQEHMERSSCIKTDPKLDEKKNGASEDIKESSL